MNNDTITIVKNQQGKQIAVIVGQIDVDLIAQFFIKVGTA